MSVTIEEVWRVGLAMPGVAMGKSWGHPALVVPRGTRKAEVFACIPTNKEAEPESLLVRVDREQRAALMAEAPRLFYAPPHYEGYDGVLVRLRELEPTMVEPVLEMGRRYFENKRAGVQPL